MNEPQDFAERLASSDPTPGGGAAAARVGLLAASLLRMVIGITRKRVGADDADAAAALEAAAGEAVVLSGRFRALEAADIDAFDGFMEALRLPRGNEEEKERREAARRAAAARATRVPLDLLATIVASLKLGRTLKDLSERTPLAAASDLTCAVEFARAAFVAGEQNVDANLPYLEASQADGARAERERLRAEMESLYRELR